MSIQPTFVDTLIVGMTQISVANANRDGTGTIETLITGAVGGTRIHRIEVCATVTTTAGMIRLYIDDGVNVRLWKEIAVTAVTPSASVATWKGILDLPGEQALLLPSDDWSVGVSTHNAETFNVFAHGGEYS